jgi:NitT/TauT family transport system ATP-binding protein
MSARQREAVTVTPPPDERIVLPGNDIRAASVENHSAGMTLRLDRVELAYAGTAVVDDFTLEVRPGEILVLAGPSGCGKSTLLRALAGLLPPRAGRILADGTPVTGPDRDRAMVFQDDALLPWRTVRANIELALKLRGMPRAGRRERAQRWIEEVGLTGFGDHLPKRLSGGMRQRVQLARGLAGAPRAVLMDEPFGALDSRTRATMQRLLIDTWHTHPTTVVFVTHDVDEALLLGDRIVVLGRAGQPPRALLTVPRPRDPAADRSALRAEILAALDHSDDIAAMS